MSIKQIFSLAGICSGCIVIALVFSMINTSLPHIGAELNLSYNTLQWMMSVFGIVNCALLVTSGRLADIFGRKKVYLIGLSSSLLGVAIGGMSYSSFGLIAAMAFAGLGNAVLLPVSQAMLVFEFGPSQAGRAIGLWTSSIGSALAAGPLLGGVISGNLGWQWIFWGLIPIILCSMFLVAAFSRESRNRVDAQDLDLPGMGLLAVLMGAVVLVLTEHASLPAYALAILGLLIPASLHLLIRVEKTSLQPILRPDLFRSRTFLAASVASAVLVYFIWALFFLFPLYLQKIRGFLPMKSGLVMLAITLPVACLSRRVGKMLGDGGSGRWIVGGFGLMLLSIALQFQLGENSSLALIVAAALAFGVGYCLIWGPSATAAIESQSKERAGIVTGTFATIQEIGGTLALATAVTAMKSQADLLDGWRISLFVLACAGLIGLASGRALISSEKSLLQKARAD